MSVYCFFYTLKSTARVLLENVEGVSLMKCLMHCYQLSSFQFCTIQVYQCCRVPQKKYCLCVYPFDFITTIQLSWGIQFSPFPSLPCTNFDELVEYPDIFNLPLWLIISRLFHQARKFHKNLWFSSVLD